MVSLHWIINEPLSWSLVSQMSSHKCNLPVTINSNIRHFDHLSGFSVSPFRPPSHNLPSEGRWEVRNDRNAEEERECCCLLSHTERLCLGMSRWWIWLALGWHMHIRRKAKTVIHSPRPQLPLPRFLWMAPSHSFPTYIHTHNAQWHFNQHNLSSPLCMQERQQYVCSVRLSWRDEGKVHD